MNDKNKPEFGPLPLSKDRPTLTIPEAAHYLGFGRTLGYEGAKTGEIPTIQVGRRKVVPTAIVRTRLGLEP